MGTSGLTGYQHKGAAPCLYKRQDLLSEGYAGYPLQGKDMSNINLVTATREGSGFNSWHKYHPILKNFNVRRSFF